MHKSSEDFEGLPPPSHSALSHKVVALEFKILKMSKLNKQCFSNISVLIFERLSVGYFSDFERKFFILKLHSMTYTYNISMA